MTTSRILRRLLLATLIAPALLCAAEPDDDDEATDTIVVNATRSPGLVRDLPLRVEAVPAEEIEENATIAPGAVTSLLKELPGVREQSVAGGLGGAGLQLRGLPARHTLVLMDGLPLGGVEPDAFSLVQTPPLDLARAEVIKGSVSALYGASALGGVLNLISRPPEDGSEILANVTDHGAQDLVAVFGGRLNDRWGATLTAGGHRQSARDLDDDGWLDLASMRRATIRPRLWWRNADGRSLYLTAGFVDEQRQGGTAQDGTLPGGGSFRESLATRRYDIGSVFDAPVNESTTFTGRLSWASSRLDRGFGSTDVRSTNDSMLAEVAWNGGATDRRWVLGTALTSDRLTVDGAAGLDYRHDGASIFAQQDWRATDWLRVSASARLDRIRDLGSFFSPRVSLLLRPPQGEWSLRASVGGGFAAPTPFVETIEETGLSTVAPLATLKAERARTASLDAKWADEGWDVNASVFVSEIRDPLTARPAPGGGWQIVNASGPWRAPGAEFLAGFTHGAWHLIGSWSYLDVTEVDAGGDRVRAPRVPRQTFSLDGIYEVEHKGRIGIEFDYTGPQALEDDPYREQSPGFFTVNLLAEKSLGHSAVFLNVMNLADRRQSDFDPILRPAAGGDGNPITEIWAPLAGRTLNAGWRVRF